LPDFGDIEWPKSETSDFGGRRVGDLLLRDVSGDDFRKGQ
jgi:hypothetical protein